MSLSFKRVLPELLSVFIRFYATNCVFQLQNHHLMNVLCFSSYPSFMLTAPFYDANYCVEKAFGVPASYDVKSWTKCSSRRLVTSTCDLAVSTCYIVESTHCIVVSTGRVVVSTRLLVMSTCRAVVSSSRLVV